MYQLIESIKLKEGNIQNLKYHQQRLNSSMKEVFPYAAKIDLAKEISAMEFNTSGIFKIRVIYDQVIAKIEFEPYNFKIIQSLKLINDDKIDYHLKYADRKVLNDLFGQRGNCDDIIIVKQGLLTDSFAANLLFYDGQQWCTPDKPLLKGTKRQQLLDRGLIVEKEIKQDDIAGFQKVGLINAMIDLDEMPVIQINDICF